MKNEVIKARTCVYKTTYHILWMTKDKKPLIKGDLKKYLSDIFYQISLDKEFIIEEIKLEENRCEFMISSHPKNSPSYIVKMLKGISGRKVQKELDDKIELWDNFYFIETIGSSNLDALNEFIK